MTDVWTVPRTFVAGEVETAAIFNAHLRANLNAINGFVRKTADESVTSSAVLQNDDQLLYTISAAGTYLFDIWLYATSAANAAGDIAVAFSFPTGTLHFAAAAADAGLASSSIQTGQWGVLLSATSGVTIAPYGLSTNNLAINLHGILIATATGTLQTMWSQSVSSVSATTVKSGSHMLVRQVA